MFASFEKEPRIIDYFNYLWFLLFIAQKILEQKYSATFAECAEIIRSRSENIDADEAELKNAMNRANPLDDIR